MNEYRRIKELRDEEDEKKITSEIIPIIILGFLLGIPLSLLVYLFLGM